MDQVAIIKKAVQVPVLAILGAQEPESPPDRVTELRNGNVKSWEDVQANLQLTGADGIMSAEGMLDDPCLFSGAPEKGLRKVEKKLRQLQRLREKATLAPLSKEEERKVAQRKELKLQRRALHARLAEAPRNGLAKAREYLKLTEL